ncbi:MAG: DinB family protein [Pirellulaceae bacterium]|nr:DinB family protein [Pirellulaceae bacterium]
MQMDDPSSTISQLIDAFEQGATRVRLAVEGLTTDELKQRPIEGKWSILEVVCHLTDTDIYHADRIERTLALDKPLLMGVDERPYPERLQFQEQDLDEEIELMSILRRRTARILRRQSDEAWLRTGIHSETGLCTVRDLVEKCVRHVDHHLTFIAEKRAVLLANRPTTNKPSPEYSLTIVWENRGPDFLHGKYSREHVWSFDGGISVPASPSPHVVPSPWSSEHAIDPEEALVAAASSCHMLTFLWLASKQGWTVNRYEDKAIGLMKKSFRKIPWIHQITLRPRIEWAADSPDLTAIEALHQAAHEQCFIANSIKCRIVIETS